MSCWICLEKHLDSLVDGCLVYRPSMITSIVVFVEFRFHSSHHPTDTQNRRPENVFFSSCGSFMIWLQTGHMRSEKSFAITGHLTDFIVSSYSLLSFFCHNFQFSQVLVSRCLSFLNSVTQVSWVWTGESPSSGCTNASSDFAGELMIFFIDWCTIRTE